MINFDFLEQNLDELRIKYLIAQPFPYLAIDNFCDEQKLTAAYENVSTRQMGLRGY